MALEPGTLLEGKYRIGEILGRGGMGVVHAGRHEALDRPVAIKVLEHDGNARAIARLRREAQILARIDNEHVCKVYDVGSLEDGTPFLVMERLEGHSLAERHDRRPSVGQVVDWMAQACEGLAEAHRHAIVHRDLKPANLFLTHRPDGETVLKLLDFGVAKPLADQDVQTITGDEAVVGSPRFMSPEQVQSSKDVDARSDIWSLGVVMHELLTGEPAFKGRTLADYFITIVHDEPTSASQLRDDLPPGLEEALARCLAKEREDRYPTIGAFAEALRPFAEPRSLAALDRATRSLDRAVAPPAFDPEASMTRDHAAPEKDPLNPEAIPATVAQEPVTLPGASPPRPSDPGPIAPRAAAPRPAPTTTGPPRALLGLAAAAVLLLGGLLVWSTRDHEAAVEASPSESATVPATTVVEPAAPPPSVVPTAIPSESPSATPSASATPARPAPAPQPPRPAPPRPAPAPVDHLPDLGI
ncbi:MAG: serine/threonine-protein kinase [Polyangiaceae bacterium]